MNKKEREYNIVRMIYNENEYKYNEENGYNQEKPDFILQRGNEEKFGVEVTELYYNETSARLKNRKNYPEDIRRGKTDKNDIKPLKIVNTYLNIGDSNENNYQFFYSSYTLPKYTEDDFKKALIKRIKEKTEKSKAYIKDLKYIELIIFDSECFFYNYTENNALKYLNNNTYILDLIRKTIFKKVYIITILNGKPEAICLNNDKYEINAKKLNKRFTEE